MRVLLLCLAIISSFVSSNGQATCGMEGTDTPWYGVPDDFKNGFLIHELESFNVAFVTTFYGSSSGYGALIETRLTTNSSGQWVAFYVASGQGDVRDFAGVFEFSYTPILRCIDGTSQEGQPTSVRFHDVNNRPPVFSADSYTFFVSLPWPSQIPINVGKPILIQDKDRSRDQINVTIGRPDLLNVEVSSLTPAGYSNDYKIDLYNLNLFPGNYSFSLEATDGVHNSVVPINLIVTEPTCRAHLRDPVFGRKGIEVQTVYQTTLHEHSLVGDALRLENDVTKIEAYIPDEVCIVDLTLDVDFLTINNEGQLVVSQKPTEKEIEAMRPFTLAEITATERGSGRLQRVPLIITIV